MASFVLVHGSGQNADCWIPVGDILKALGHRVDAPDLPKRAADWRLRDYAAEIARAVRVPGTVVVTHSFSGVFLPLVAQARDCALLVFLAAVIPEPAKSVRDQFTADPSMFCPDWIAAGQRWFDPEQRESLAREFLFHDCDEQTLTAALPTLQPYDTRNLVTEPAPLPAWPETPVASIVATEDRTLTPDWCRRAARRLGVQPIEVQTGHCPQTSRPEEIADILERLSAREPAGWAGAVFSP